MTGPRALVVGAGIAGLAAASSLHRAGWRVTVCERAASRRTGGYFVRLAPEGVEAAARLGVEESLRSRLPADGLITGVDGRGRTTSRVDAGLVDDGEGLALVRGDLEAALWAGLPEAVEVRFATQPRVVSPAHGTVTLVHGGTEVTDRFDLVVAADGVRSTVRDLVFGPEEDFRHDFDHAVVSAVLPRLPGDLVQGDYVVLVEPGRSALALAGGESLGRHLAVVAGVAPDVPAALRDWEAERRPGTAVARTAARRARHFFLPGNRVVTAVRQAALRTVSRPWVARLLRASSRGRA